MAGIYKNYESLFGPIIEPVLPQDYKYLVKDEQLKVKKEFKMKKVILRRGKIRSWKKLKKFVNRFRQQLFMVFVQGAENYFF